MRLAGLFFFNVDPKTIDDEVGLIDGERRSSEMTVFWLNVSSGKYAYQFSIYAGRFPLGLGQRGSNFIT